MSEIKSYIEVSPSKRLVFNLSHGSHSTTSLALNNICSSSILIKIKSNQRARYSVKPNQFVLKSTESRVVEFTIKKDVVDELLNEAQSTNSPIPIKDKFQILSLVISEKMENELKNVADNTASIEIMNRRWKLANDNEQRSDIVAVDYTYPDSFFSEPMKDNTYEIPQVHEVTENQSQEIETLNSSLLLLKKQNDELTVINHSLEDNMKKLQESYEKKIDEIEYLKESLKNLKDSSIVQSEEETKETIKEGGEGVTQDTVAVLKNNYINILNIIVLLFAIIIAYIIGKHH
ncbi:hypothetical protein WA158_000448 [Blastocystis sp. Blastoise]